jgi:threonine dehydrogenase-like Zn-dependent dehydrogenase
VISLQSGLLRVVDGTNAFLDRDWLGGGGDGTLPALHAATAEEAAGRLLATVDHILGQVGQAPTDVLGDGFVARSLRSALPAPGGRAAAVVDCTGDPIRLLELIRSVQDGGMIVLAGEPVGRELRIDLYVDVHRRGLRIVGAPRPETCAPVTDDARVRHALQQLEHVRPGAAPPAAPWFAVSAV